MKIELFDGDVRDLYEAIARGESRAALLQRVYDMFADDCYLRPPALEERVAEICDTGGARNG